MCEIIGTSIRHCSRFGSHSQGSNKVREKCSLGTQVIRERSRAETDLQKPPSRTGHHQTARRGRWRIGPGVVRIVLRRCVHATGNSGRRQWGAKATASPSPSPPSERLFPSAVGKSDSWSRTFRGSRKAPEFALASSAVDEDDDEKEGKTQEKTATRGCCSELLPSGTSLEYPAVPSSPTPSVLLVHAPPHIRSSLSSFSFLFFILFCTASSFLFFLFRLRGSAPSVQAQGGTF